MNIYFDNNRKSRYGKLIPLDPDTSKPHECQSTTILEPKSLGEIIKDSENRVTERYQKL